ncbi:hypothetical protein [Liquorilactobacillus satsumensis]|uniref:hypothetical protein n=1 Tax=Liquorilactobacillus satsumensis TaxID=259059 RepID=UPI0006D269C8|nr:hypothetical protein [Liquorilactobacillus satsumensis]
MNEHSFRKNDVDAMLETHKDVRPIVSDILSVLSDRQEYCYQQKETALHLANEVLFERLVTKTGD